MMIAVKKGFDPGMTTTLFILMVMNNIDPGPRIIFQRPVGQNFFNDFRTTPTVKLQPTNTFLGS